MDSHDLLSLYGAVAVISSQMLVAARSGDWDQVAVLETHFASHVRTLKKDEAPIKLTGENRVRKVQLINKILADDREIRDIAEPWMAQLSQLINNSSVERRLVQAYGAVAGTSQLG